MKAARHGAHAYRAAASLRSQRNQEADVFRRANGALQAGLGAGGMARVRAIADNRRLWLAVADLMADPSNALPVETRAGLISLSLSVRREMERPEPDIGFLIGINSQIIEGLEASG